MTKFYLRKGISFIKTFTQDKYQIDTRYCSYLVLPEGAEACNIYHITEDSYLSKLLSILIGKNKEIEISERMAKIFRIALRNSNRWKIYSRAWNIHKEKGLEATLDFLEEKLSVFILSEKLKVR